MAVSVNKRLAASYILEDPLGRIANYGRVSSYGLTDKLGMPAQLFYAYNFDGSNDYGQLASRAINPDGDNVIEFWPPTGANNAILSQNIQTTVSLTEFLLFNGSSGELRVTFGGSGTSLATVADGYVPGHRYKLTMTGTSYTLQKNGVQIKAGTFAKGAAREPAATTKVYARTNAGSGVNLLGAGLLPDLRINGFYWAMDLRGESVQPSLPSGNNMTLFNTNIERWQQIDGSVRASQESILTPQITSQPSDQSVSIGATPTFSVSASVEIGSLTYQWQLNGSDLISETSSSLTLPPVAPSDNGSTARVKVSANGRDVFSRSALLTVSGSDPFLEGGRIASTSELYSTAELYS